MVITRVSGDPEEGRSFHVMPLRRVQFFTKKDFDEAKLHT